MNDLSTAWSFSLIRDDRVLQMMSGERPSTLAEVYAALATPPLPGGRRRGRKPKDIKDKLLARIEAIVAAGELGDNQNEIVAQLQIENFDYCDSSLKEILKPFFKAR